MMNRLVGAACVIMATNILSLVVLIPVPLNVLLTASAMVYLGAARSLKYLLDAPTAESAAKKKKREDSITLSSGDAARFPIVGSAVLIAAYVLITIFGRKVINILLTLYFAGFGAFAVEAAVESELLELPWFENREWPFRFGRLVEVRPLILAKATGIASIDFRLNTLQVCCWLGSCAVVTCYAWTKHWILNNAIAICLCVSGLESVSVGSFRNGAILLCGLFVTKSRCYQRLSKNAQPDLAQVYDIYWVFFSNRMFGNNVMVAVAKGIDGPIKLLFVRSFKSADASPGFNMLGLGDVVVPGLFIAMLLRFDARKAKRDGTDGSVLVGTFPAPYFHRSMIAYIVGLALTLYVMYAFDAAQPALLYLVPAVLGTAICSGKSLGELNALLTYSEEHTRSDEDEARPVLSSTAEDRPSSTGQDGDGNTSQ